MAIMNFDPKKLLKAEIGLVYPNPWNPKGKDTDEYRRILKGIKEKGLRLPIPVREKPNEDGGKYEIIDGEQRFRAARQLGFREIILYNEGVIPDQEAKELTIWYQQQVPFDEIKLAGLIADITSGGDFSLPYSGEEISLYKELLTFSWDELGAAEIVLTESDPNQITTIRVTNDILQRVMEVLNSVTEPRETGQRLKIITTRPLLITHAQKEIVERALNFVKTREKVKDGRALELICADYLSGADDATPRNG